MRAAFDIPPLRSLFWHLVKPFYIATLATWFVLGGCGRKPEPAAPAAPEESRGAKPDHADARPVIVAFGDSLSAGQGAGEGHSYPDYLQSELDRRGYAYRVVNAGISGDTTGGGLARIGEVLALRPAIVILELGANDGLRGIPIASSQANLDQMIATLKKADARVVLAGMTLPPNYGPDYIRSFERMFTTLAAKHRLPLIPFLLEGVAGVARYMQDDGLHPTAEGHRLVAANVLKTLEPLLKKGTDAFF
jgi:acyl-CoA thioesterase-1